MNGWKSGALALAGVAFTAIGLAQSDAAPGTRDGQVRSVDGETFVAWDAEGKRWLSPDAFWQVFAERGRGRHWGAGEAFPPYDDVGEHDTFLYQTVNGDCLMYFFHTRWRRANDVRRWGPAFNDYSGCPTVFD